MGFLHWICLFMFSHCGSAVILTFDTDQLLLCVGKLCPLECCPALFDWTPGQTHTLTHKNVLLALCCSDKTVIVM